MSRGPGHSHWISGTYLEIEAPRRLRFTYVNEADGFETVVKLDFEETEAGHTRMLFRQSPFLNAAECNGHGWGWRSGFDLFDRYVREFIDADWRPKGPPRAEGVAADLLAARQRHLDDKPTTQTQERVE